MWDGLVVGVGKRVMEATENPPPGSEAGSWPLRGEIPGEGLALAVDYSVGEGPEGLLNH